MKNIFTILLAIFITGQVYSQTEGVRYIDEVFDSVVVETGLQYGANLTVITAPDITVDTLLFDLYQPFGDTASTRPLAVVLNTGTFLPRGLTSPTGGRDDYANQEICRRLAKRGYVAASVEYRVGWDPQNTQEIVRRATIIQAAYRAVQDLYTFLRYANLTIDDLGNPYRINSDKVAVVGIGTGGFVGLNAGVLNDVSEIYIPKFSNPITGVPYIDTLLLGNITGEQAGQINLPNHVGYKQDFHFVFSLDGAVGDSSWMEEGPSPPLVVVGTVTNPTTPFGINPITDQIDCELPVFTGAGTGIFVVDIGGSACVLEKANALGINDPLNDFNFNDPVSNVLREGKYAQEHLWPINFPDPQAGPWEYWDSTFWKQVPNLLPDFENIHEAGIATNPDMSLEKANRYIDTALWFFSPRACVVLDLGNCGVVSSTQELNPVETGFKIAPNPASAFVTVQSNDQYPIEHIQVFDMLGQSVRFDRVENTFHEVDISSLAPGFYVLRAKFEKGFISEKIMVQRR